MDLSPNNNNPEQRIHQTSSQRLRRFFPRTDLSVALLEGAHLEETILREADLEEAILREAKLKGAVIYLGQI